MSKVGRDAPVDPGPNTPSTECHGEAVHFCSASCREKFVCHPEKRLADYLYHLIIVGGGPAGLSAGIYASLGGLDTLLFSKSIGGQAWDSTAVVVYPGFDLITGPELVERFQRQLFESLHLDHRICEVTALAKEQGVFRVTTRGEESFRSRTVLLDGSRRKEGPKALLRAPGCSAWRTASRRSSGASASASGPAPSTHDTEPSRARAWPRPSAPCLPTGSVLHKQASKPASGSRTVPVPRPSHDRFAYADYLTWPEGERWELIDGDACDMTPAPTFTHQRVVLRLAHLLESALEGHRCVPCVAPVDVVLADDTVVQPDVLVVCDRSKIRPAGVFGPPDLIAEVLSPTTGLRDRRTKRDLYERFGVSEYLLVDPEARYTERFTLGDGGTYGRGELFGPDEVVLLASLGGLGLRLAEVFEVAPAEPETSAPG